MNNAVTRNVETTLNGLKSILCDNVTTADERERIEQVVDDLNGMLSRHGLFGYDVMVEGYEEMDLIDYEPSWYRLSYKPVRSFDDLDDAIAWAREMCLKYPEMPLTMAETFDGACVCIYECHRYKKVPIKSFVLVKGEPVQEYTGDECDHDLR